MKTTRTLNPLHFEDLEPHRFEDLVRQIIYDFRSWDKIEATGRLGGDGGVDILAIEKIEATPETKDEDDGDEEAGVELRPWIIQCKREKRLGPADLTRIVGEATENRRPYGLMVVVACDLSAKAREAFRAAAVARGIQEFALWGKAELEDLLFKPANDHLLFAYFGISLQLRKRSIKSELRSRLAIKRKLIRVLGDVGSQKFSPVLIRDARSPSEYPQISSVKAFRKMPAWRYRYFIGHDYPDHLAFVLRRHKAWTNDDGSKWDALEKFDESWPGQPKLAYLPDEKNLDAERNLYTQFWWGTPEHNRGWYSIVGLVHYDNILAVDEFGDSYNPGPHLIVDFETPQPPFSLTKIVLEVGSAYSKRRIDPDKKNRKKFFPDVPPPGIAFEPKDDSNGPL